MAQDKLSLPAIVERARRSTITDVAKLAEVSIKTVSRVVRREPNVSEETRKAVNEAIEQLNYRPTISARSTTGARSYLLGLVFDNPVASYNLSLLTGAQQAARDNGYHLVFEPLANITKPLGDAVSELVIQGNLDGLIVPPPLCDNPEVLTALASLNRPFARIAPDADTNFGFGVSIDDFAAAYAVTQHLLGLGHHRIAHVMGTAQTTTTDDRLRGYQTALRDAGIAQDKSLLKQGDFRTRSGLECGNELLNLKDPPTAVFAANDEMAAGVMMAAYQRGMNIPQDISIAGFDDTETATSVSPNLTTVLQPVEEMAAAAAKGLIEFLRGGEESPPDIKLDFQLQVRGSTGPAPAR